MSALLLAPLGDRVTYRLNDLYPLVPGGDVQFADASADGEWIVYRADAEEDNVQNLYSVPTDGSAAPEAITFSTNWTQALADITISPAGTRVLYLQRPTGAPKSTLYSVPTDGSALPVDLSGPHVTSYQAVALNQAGLRFSVAQVELQLALEVQAKLPTPQPSSGRPRDCAPRMSTGCGELRDSPSG